MKISVKRSGGYAGLTESIVDLDTTQLDTMTAQKVGKLIKDLGIFNLPGVVSGDELGADFFRYEITIIQGGQEHTVVFNDDNSQTTAPLRNFVETLSQIR